MPAATTSSERGGLGKNEQKMRRGNAWVGRSRLHAAKQAA